jgi:nucleoside-diphosphate-sugar epimerase
MLTGATGTVGREVLAALLARGRSVLLLLRTPLAPRLEALGRFLADEGHDLQELQSTGRIRVLVGDLADGPPPPPPGLAPARVIHAAASVRFDPAPDGDPVRTNVEGTGHLLQWMVRHHVRELNLISTAYIGDGRRGPALERPVADDAPAHNAYERSKRAAEALATAWASERGRRLTILRPSIVVGRHDDGRIASCSGVYLAFRAVELLARQYEGSPQRHEIPLRLDGRADAPLDLVPADWVAAMIVGISEDPALGGRIHHLVHPTPPTNALVQRGIERAFDVAGGRFIGQVAADEAELSRDELAFRRTIGPIRPYLVDGPRFDATNAIAAATQLDRPCPAWDEAAIVRLIRFALASRWGRRPVRTSASPATAAAAIVSRPHPCADYFERHLPEQVERSEVARRAAITATVRFVLEDLDADAGIWTCRFEAGRLAWTRRGADAPVADFGYRVDSRGFHDVVGGSLEPHRVFLEGRAEIEGDVERALMMGVVLEEFNRCHPWRPEDAA